MLTRPPYDPKEGMGAIAWGCGLLLVAGALLVARALGWLP